MEPTKTSGIQLDQTGIDRPLQVERGSWRLIRYYDLALLVGLALVLPALPSLSVPWLRVPLGLTLVLLAPGYALTCAIFARRQDLDGVGRAALSFGLSVVIVPFLALVLDLLPWGIRVGPITIALSVSMLAFSIVAATRRYLLGPSSDAASSQKIDVPSWWSRLNGIRKLSYLIGICLVLGTLIWVGTIFVAYKQPAHLTEFYALNTGGKVEDYPRQTVPGEQVQIRLGITNHEGGPGNYRMEARSGMDVLVQLGPISVADGSTWEEPVTFAMKHAGVDQQIDIALFRSNQADPFRQLQLWIDVRDKTP